MPSWFDPIQKKRDEILVPHAPKSDPRPSPPPSGGGGSGGSRGGSGGSSSSQSRNIQTPGGIDPYSKLGMVLSKKVRIRKNITNTSPSSSLLFHSPTHYREQMINPALENLQGASGTKTDLKTAGQNYIDFNPNTPVDIEGKTYPGEDVMYTVDDFQPRFLHGHTTSEKGSTKNLSATQYDIYLANMGRYYLEQSEKIDLNVVNTQIAALTEQKAATYDWHKDTKIRGKKNEEGGYNVTIDFPFSGADVYRSTRKNINNANILQRYSLALTPSNFAGIPATVEYLRGNKDKAHQIEVEAVADTRKNFLEFYIGSPMGTLGLMAVTYGAGSVIAPAVGSLSAAHPVGFAIGSKVIGTGAKLAIGGYAAYDFTKKLSEDEFGKAFGNAARLGLNYYGMSSMGKLGMSRINPKTGQTYLAGGAKTGQLKYNARLFDKDANKVINLLNKQGGKLTPMQEGKYMTAWKAGGYSTKINYDFRILSDIALNKPISSQPEPIWDVSKIKNISNNRFLQGFKNIWQGNRSSKIIGGMGSNKPLTGDIDVQLTPYGKAQYNVVLKNLGYKLDMGHGVDWHYMQPTGSMVTTHGGTALNPYRYPSGGSGIKWQEQLTRLFHSGWNPAHAGRVKDISEGYRMVQQIYPSGFPKSLGFSMGDYAKTTSFVSQHPNIMMPATSSLYYSPGLSDAFKNVKSGFYEKMFKPLFKGQSSHISSLLDVKPTSSILPPSPSYSPSSSMLSMFNIGSTISPSKIMKSSSISFSPFNSHMSSVIKSSSSSSLVSRLFSSSTSSSSSMLFSSSTSSSSSMLSSLFSSGSGSSSSISSFSSGSGSSSSSSSGSSSSGFGSSLTPFPLWIPRGLAGRGMGSWGESGRHKKRYMFRQFKVPSIDKILRGI